MELLARALQEQKDHAGKVSPLLERLASSMGSGDMDTLYQIEQNLATKARAVELTGRAFVISCGLVDETFDNDQAPQLKEQLKGLSNKEIKTTIELILELADSNTARLHRTIKDGNFASLTHVGASLLLQACNTTSLHCLVNVLVDILAERAEIKK